MTPEEIKEKLDKKGIRQVDLCRRWRVPPSTMSRFINRQFDSRRLAKKLARALGVSIEELTNGGREGRPH